MLMNQTAIYKSKYSKYNMLLKLTPYSSYFVQPSNHFSKHFGYDVLLKLSGWKLSHASYFNQSIWDWVTGTSLCD